MFPGFSTIAYVVSGSLIASYAASLFLYSHSLVISRRRRNAMRLALAAHRDSPEWSDRRIENPGLFGGKILLDKPKWIIVQFEYGPWSERPQRRAWFSICDFGVTQLTAAECESFGIIIPTRL